MTASIVSAVFFILLSVGVHAAKGQVQTPAEQREPWTAKHALIITGAFFAVWLLGLWTGMTS